MSPAPKVVLIAGGTGGLGLAVSLAFLAEGAVVNVTYHSTPGWDALKNAAASQGQSVDGFHVDVTHEAAVVEMIEEIVAKNGRLDALVNTVGGYAGGVKLWDLDPQVFDQMLQQNLRSGFVLSRIAARQMIQQGTGSIVNVGSRAAFDHSSGAAAYAASKAAALAMIDSLAADLKGTGVRANSVMPSIFDTEANRKAMPNADFSKWPQPKDIARVILFLCSDAAKLIHGAAIPVYGDS